MTILNNGLIGINTASPDEKIHVHGGSNIARLKLSGGALAQSYGGFVESEGVSGLGGQLRLGVIDNGVYRKGIEILEQSNQIKINTAGSEAMRIESDGTIRAKTGSFVVDTAGQGIYIGGTVAANKLDDYEEGTFAPTITATGTDTGVSGSGQYTKIGNQVHVEIRITKFLDEDDSCAIQSVTLPFTAKATSNVNYKGNVFMFTGNIVNQYARLQEGTNSLTLNDPFVPSTSKEVNPPALNGTLPIPTLPLESMRILSEAPVKKAKFTATLELLT